MRTKALAFVAALALLTLAPVAAQQTGYEAEDPQAVETEATAEATVEATAEPMAPEAVELGTAEVPEPAVESTAPLAEEQASEELPRTASPLALLALLGLGSAGSALGLRSLRRK